MHTLPPWAGSLLCVVGPPAASCSWGAPTHKMLSLRGRARISCAQQLAAARAAHHHRGAALAAAAVTAVTRGVHGDGGAALAAAATRGVHGDGTAALAAAGDGGDGALAAGAAGSGEGDGCLSSHHILGQQVPAWQSRWGGGSGGLVEGMGGCCRKPAPMLQGARVWLAQAACARQAGLLREVRAPMPGTSMQQP